jgi:hypothetical protein
MRTRAFCGTAELPISRHDVEAAFDLAYGDLRGSVPKDSLPELASRLVMTRLADRDSDRFDGDVLYPQPTFW